MKFGVKTDKGRQRDINEDSYNIIAGYTGVPVSFVIADGMGGHNSGEVASKMAVDFISNQILQSPEIIEEQKLFDSIKEIMQKTNSFVFAKSKEHEDNYGMGTTLIVAIVCNKKLFIGHIGDSRVYLIRNGSIQRLTTDHTFIEELMQTGSITPEEAMNHPKRHILTRALGCAEHIQIDTYLCKMEDDDMFILCTDGLTNKLNEEEIMDIALKTENMEAVCEELVSSANERGGEDNITVIAFKI